MVFAREISNNRFIFGAQIFIVNFLTTFFNAQIDIDHTVFHSMEIEMIQFWGLKNEIEVGSF
jgi:hypothetical protein